MIQDIVITTEFKTHHTCEPQSGDPISVLSTQDQIKQLVRGPETLCMKKEPRDQNQVFGLYEFHLPSVGQFDIRSVVLRDRSYADREQGCRNANPVRFVQNGARELNTQIRMAFAFAKV